MNVTLENATPETPVLLNAPVEIASQPQLSKQIDDACRRIPPLWPLKNFVAVNPFLGLSDQNFLDAGALMQRVTHADMLMPAGYYREMWDSGQITPGDLQDALQHARHALPAEQALEAENLIPHNLLEFLENGSNHENPGRIFTVAETVDNLHNTDWAQFITDEISKWCSAYYDEGQASWQMPWRGESLFDAWKQAAQNDANPEMMGLKNFRSLMKQWPLNAQELIEYSLKELQVPIEGAMDFLHRELMSIGGWSAYVQYHVREKAMVGQSDDSLRDLLAIRLAYDVALKAQYTGSGLSRCWTAQMESLAQISGENSAQQVLAQYIWQLAAENAYQRKLIAKIGATVAAPAKTERAAVQAIFCIDVRSEVYRRTLEAQSANIETLGFAGFFGFPIEIVPFGEQQGAAQCPVLLTPKFRIRETASGATPEKIETLLEQRNVAKKRAQSWSSFKTSAVSCFSFVETAGLLSGWNLVKDSLGLASTHKETAFAPDVAHQEHSCGMKLDEQIAVAHGALKNMGLTKDFARIVLICGHGSETVNNPYGSGLDCGACGGHTGEANARIAAQVLNNIDVRAGLQSQGISIPEDTIFVAALHNTTTDDITIFDEYSIPASHQDDLQQLKTWLSAASSQARQQRAKSLGLGEIADSQIDEKVRARSRDWSQVRPEWGLAGNAAFVAAPRERTQGLNLEGRTFLHNYDFAADDGSILELIMTAPMVVASWINLQYYASTVNNQQWGSGNKTIHNVVGGFGVWQGNGGDLQVGLPLQSLHNGQKWMHEPLRLSVFIEAPRSMMDAVIEKHSNVRDLLDNGWIQLFAMEDEGHTIFRYRKDLHWSFVPGPTAM
jgi:uncharacterized protein YbcC (UPF0753/DUF2309 family)